MTKAEKDDWKQETCQSCYYRVGDSCRRNPTPWRVRMPAIAGVPEEWDQACAQWVPIKEGADDKS